MANWRECADDKKYNSVSELLEAYASRLEICYAQNKNKLLTYFTGNRDDDDILDLVFEVQDAFKDIITIISAMHPEHRDSVFMIMEPFIKQQFDYECMLI